MVGELSVKRHNLISTLPTASTKRQAGIDAGFSPKSAHVAVSRALKDDKVQAALRERAKKVERASIANEVERREILTKVLREREEGPYPVQAALSASDQLNRMDSIYVDRSESKNWNLNLDAAALAEIERQFTIEELRAIVAHKGRHPSAGDEMAHFATGADGEEPQLPPGKRNKMANARRKAK